MGYRNVVIGGPKICDPYVVNIGPNIDYPYIYVVNVGPNKGYRNVVNRWPKICDPLVVNVGPQ